MTTSRIIEAKATGKEMTLGELRAFIAEMDEAGAAETTSIKADVTFRQGLKSLRATVNRLHDTE